MPKNYEKPQKGNPHQLTIDQHVFPVKSIQRFINSDGTIWVHRKSENKSFQVVPNDSIFCAKRVWDQRAESGYMKEIEDKFQSIADLIVNGSLLNIGIEETRIINDFWRLWIFRAEFQYKPIPDAKLNIIAPSIDMNKDQQEQLEKLHVGTIRPDCSIPGRDIAGIQIQMKLMAARKNLIRETWGIVKAHEGEFIVPDCFLKDGKTASIVPLTATCCLVLANKNAVISLEDVRYLNRFAVECSQRLYFAKDFLRCPL